MKWNFNTLFIYLASYIFGTTLLVSCSVKEGALFYGSLGIGETRVILSSSSATVQNITIYDGNGNFKGLLADYNNTGGTPRGLSYLTPVCFLGAIEALDQIEKICIDGTPKSLWGKNSQVTTFNGLLYLPESKNTLAIDANTIEKFDFNGVRIPPTGTTPYIATTIGGCTLSGPTRMALNNAGELLVTNPTNERITVYDISETTPTCISSVDFSASAAADPQAILSHSNGSIYIATIVNTNETIWRTDSRALNPTAVFTSQTALIQDANALAELPSGNILVSSFGTDAIVELTPEGEFVRIFAKDTNTVDVFDIHVLSGDNP